MPTAQVILDQLAAVAQSWWPLAVVWHVHIAAVAISLLCGWRPSRRPIAVLVSMPVVSALVVAAVTANPFTTTLLGAALLGIQVAVWRLPSEPIRPSKGSPLLVGSALIVFGLVYPHFLTAGTTAMYLYAAPTGLVPCPTLAVLAGSSIALGSLGSRLWATIVAAAGLVYGIIGSLYLGVRLDWVLVAGSLFLLKQGLWPKGR